MLGQVHPIDSIYEFIIRKLNPLVVAATSVNSNLHSCMCNEQWIFYENLSVFGGIEKSLSGCNCFEDIYIKFKKTELVEIIILFHNYLALEFTVHYLCRNGILGGLLDLN